MSYSVHVNNAITNTVKFHHQTDENIVASLFTSFVNKQGPNISLIRVISYPYLWYLLERYGRTGIFKCIRECS